VYERAHHVKLDAGLGALWQSNALFEQAIRLDPDFAAPYLLRHDAYVHFAFGDRHMRDRDPGVEAALPADAAEAAAMTTATLDAAVARTTIPALRIVIEINRDFLAGDWKRLPARFRELRALPDHCTGISGNIWGDNAMLSLGYAPMLREIRSECLRIDPLSISDWTMLAMTSYALGDPKRALELVEEGERVAGASLTLRTVRHYAWLALGRAAEVVAEVPPLALRDETFTMRATAAVAMARTGALHEARGLLAALREENGDAEKLVWVLREVGDHEASNALAARIDAEPMGVARLARLLYACGGRTPFDLAATPRLAAQLAAVGYTPPPLSVPLVPATDTVAR